MESYDKSEIYDLQNRVVNLENENKKLKSRIDDLERKSKHLETKIISVDGIARAKGK